jgi:hypothetical protein
MNDIKDKKDDKAGWSNAQVAGAAVGSAALMAALLYAGKQVAKRKPVAKPDEKFEPRETD